MLNTSQNASANASDSSLFASNLAANKTASPALAGSSSFPAPVTALPAAGSGHQHNPAAMTQVFGHLADDAAPSTSSKKAAAEQTPKAIPLTLPPELGHLQGRIDRYNALPHNPADHAQHLQTLRELDTHAYQWFAQNPTKELSQVPHSGAVQQMLTHAQEEHARIVNTIRMNTLAGTETELPIDTRGMSPQEKQQAHTLWTSLAKQEGGLKVGDDHTSEEFKARTYGNLAKIMQGRHGRSLLTHVNQPDSDDKDVRIVAGAHPQTQADDQSKADMARALPGQADGKQIADLSGEAIPALSMMNKMMLTSMGGPRTDGIRLATGNTYLFGEGTGSTLRMPQSWNAPRSLGPNKNEIYTPEFVSLAHELGHAAKIRSGARGQDTPMEAVAPGERPADYNHSAEEYLTVHGVENVVRTENNVQRRGHYADSIHRTRLNGMMELYTNHRDQLGHAEQSQLARDLSRPGNLNDDRNYETRLANLQAALPGTAAETEAPQASGSRWSGARRVLNSLARKNQRTRDPAPSM